ncbi:hypothetical protein ACOSQ4_030167 [Xanthoceras sorbifolium]
MKDLTMGLQTLDAKVEQRIRRNQLPPPSIPLPPHVGQCSQVPLTQNFTEAALQLKSMRLDVPRFPGANPIAWVSHIQRYFDYYNTPDPERLLIASLHLDDDALDWFDWMSKNHLIFGWPEFLVAIEIRFGPSEYEDHFGKLSKLVQSNVLVDYQYQFEQLANKILGVPDHACSSQNMSGPRYGPKDKSHREKWDYTHEVQRYLNMKTKVARHGDPHLDVPVGRLCRTT